jgi:hypothetical protein
VQVPSDSTLGELVWNSIQAVIRVAACGSKLSSKKKRAQENGPRFISFNELVRLLKERGEKFLSEQPHSANMAREIEAQNVTIKTLHKQVRVGCCRLALWAASL